MSVFYSLLEFLLPKAVELRAVAIELVAGSRTTLCAGVVHRVPRSPIGQHLTAVKNETTRARTRAHPPFF